MQARYQSEEYTDMSRKVLCATNAYEKKYYFNEEFSQLPEDIKNELRIISTLFTEEVGGIFSFVFEDDGELVIETDADEDDILYDEIGAGLLVRKIQMHRQELFEKLTLFYKVFFLGEGLEDE